MTLTYDQHCYLYEYDLTNETEKKITVVGDAYTTYYKPDLEVDRTNHILYIGESGSSGSDLEAISTIDYTRIDKTTYKDGYGFPYPDRIVILDGEDIFYAGHKIDKNDLSNVLGQYEDPDFPYNEDVYYVNGNYVFTDIAVYDRNTYQKIFNIDNSTLITIDSSNNLYLYGADFNTIYQFSSVEQYSMAYSEDFFAALISTGDLFLLWSPATGAEEYNFYYEFEDEPSRPINLEFSYLEDPDTGYLYTVIPKSSYDHSWYDKNIYFGVTAIKDGKESTISHMYKVYMDSEIILRPKSPTNLEVIYDDTAEPILRATWETVPDVDGYNIYYKTINDLDFTKLNSETVTQSVYDSTITEVVYDINFGEIDTINWEGQVIDFAVTSIDNGYESNKTIASYIFTDNNLIPIEPVDTIEPIEEPENTTNNTTPSTTNKSEPKPVLIESTKILDDISTIEITTTEDGTTVSFELNETQFEEIIDLENIEEYIINIENQFDKVIVTIPGGSYNKLNGQGVGRKIVINTDSGKYFLPVNNVNIIEELEKHENADVEIEITKIKIETMEQNLTIKDYKFIAEPVEFSVNIVTENEKIEIKSFGSEYVERWIPLTQEPVKKNTVGVMYNPKTGLMQPVPTTFYKDGNGNYFAIIKRNGNSIYSVVEHEKSFNDIDGYTAKEDIELLASKLIVNGVSETEFAPDKTVTRAEYAALLVRALGLTSDNSSEIKFSDVKDDDWYAETVKIAVEYGLINGYGDGTFKPNNTISREEIIVMTVNALQFVKGKQEADKTTVSQYLDHEFISNWAIDSIAIASEEQIIKANANNNFVPDQDVTRAESVEILVNLLDNIGLIEY